MQHRNIINFACAFLKINISKIIYIFLKKFFYISQKNSETGKLRNYGILAFFFLAHSNNSRGKQTLPQIVCALLSPIPTKREGALLICSLDVETQIKIKYDIKARFMRPLLCYGEVARYSLFQKWDSFCLSELG
jgi:hypothetical protein